MVPVGAGLFYHPMGRRKAPLRNIATDAGVAPHRHPGLLGRVVDRNAATTTIVAVVEIRLLLARGNEVRGGRGRVLGDAVERRVRCSRGRRRTSASEPGRPFHRYAKVPTRLGSWLPPAASPPPVPPPARRSPPRADGGEGDGRRPARDGVVAEAVQRARDAVAVARGRGLVQHGGAEARELGEGRDGAAHHPSTTPRRTARAACSHGARSSIERSSHAGPRMVTRRAVS